MHCRRRKDIFEKYHEYGNRCPVSRCSDATTHGYLLYPCPCKNLEIPPFHIHSPVWMDDGVTPFMMVSSNISGPFWWNLVVVRSILCISRARRPSSPGWRSWKSRSINWTSARISSHGYSHPNGAYPCYMSTLSLCMRRSRTTATMPIMVYEFHLWHRTLKRCTRVHG